MVVNFYGSGNIFPVAKHFPSFYFISVRSSSCVFRRIPRRSLSRRLATFSRTRFPPGPASASTLREGSYAKPRKSPRARAIAANAVNCGNKVASRRSLLRSLRREMARVATRLKFSDPYEIETRRRKNLAWEPMVRSFLVSVERSSITERERRATESHRNVFVAFFCGPISSHGGALRNGLLAFPRSATRAFRGLWQFSRLANRRNSPGQFCEKADLLASPRADLSDRYRFSMCSFIPVSAALRNPLPCYVLPPLIADRKYFLLRMTKQIRFFSSRINFNAYVNASRVRVFLSRC